MICCKMDSSFDTSVPEMSEFDFDLGTMDTFEDLDINMTAMDMLSSDSDPFGDFSLEQSFNLIELNKFVTSSVCSEALLEDMDNDKEDIMKHDIMWSSCHSNTFTMAKSDLARSTHSTPTKLSLTPPTSYINQIFSSSCTASPPLSSDEEEASAVSCHNNDHCYSASTQSPSSSLLTPPESSEDEDSLCQSPVHIKPRKTCLTQIANDRLNKGVKSRPLGKNLTTTDKAKFKFSIKIQKNSRHGSKTMKGKKFSKITYQALKENKQHNITFSPLSRQTIKISEKSLVKSGEKLSNREARDVHNQMERQRRSELNRAYAKLKDFIPSIANTDRASKQMVLDKAIEHCRTLKTREETCREQRRNLHARNEALRKRLQALQSQVSVSQMTENAQWDLQGW